MIFLSIIIILICFIVFNVVGELYLKVIVILVKWIIIMYLNSGEKEYVYLNENNKFIVFNVWFFEMKMKEYISIFVFGV